MTLVNNAFTQPDNPKLRRIRTGNKAFVARLGGKDGGVDALTAFGFVHGVDAKQQPMLQLNRTEPAFVESAMAVLAQLRAILPPTDTTAPAGNGGAPASASAGAAPTLLAQPAPIVCAAHPYQSTEKAHTDNVRLAFCSAGNVKWPDLRETQRESERVWLRVMEVVTTRAQSGNPSG